jgi:N-acetylglutamate synthase-like GNAT family acetyltransferase
MPPYCLRPALQADFPTIKALIHEVGINPTGLDWQRFVVAATEAGEMAGCGQIKPHADASLELASIAVTPAWRKRGVASAIIQHLIASQADSAQPAPLFLTCRASLGNFYTQFGFREIPPAEMTPYFRRLHHLAHLFQTLHVFNEAMLVMKRDP